MFITSPPDTRTKLSLLSQASQYDLACACGTAKNADHRTRAGGGAWLYPVTLPDGGKSVLLKTLMSNVCVNNCKYCPLREGRDVQRCSIDIDAMVRVFMEYYRAGEIFGMFLSSGVVGTPDNTMDRLTAVASVLRKREQFKGYIHLKVIPGASDAAIEKAVAVANTVSINIETPGENHFGKVCSSKNYLEDIIRPMKLISRLSAEGGPYARTSQVTQFMVGASDESDKEIVTWSAGLYNRLGLRRIYFNAYQRGLGSPDIPGERSGGSGEELLTREHRLYQADWLMRRYGFEASELPFEPDGNFSLTVDPKERWARLHPERFPIDINRAGKLELLRVPGIGERAAARILAARKGGGKVRDLAQVGMKGKLLVKAKDFVCV